MGAHRVAIAASKDAAAVVAGNPGDAKQPKGNYMVGKSLIPTAYNDPNTSGLTAEIKSGENTVEFKLFSTGPKP